MADLSPTETADARTNRPLNVTLAAALQLLFAAVFVIAPTVLVFYGAAGQAAAEAEVVRQGFPADVLVRHNIRFAEGPGLLFIPFAMTLLSTVLGLLNLAGKRIGWVVSLVYEPLLLIVGGLIIGGQLFAAQLLERAFQTSGDATLARLNAEAIATAVSKAWPSWFYPYTTYARFALATLGSLLVIVLLLSPSAKAYFRKVGP